MNVQPSLAAIPHVAVVQQQRWLYWNTAANVAAMWIRHGRTYLSSETGIDWEEVSWATDRPLEVTAAAQEMVRATCILVGIDVNDIANMLGSLNTLKSCSERLLPKACFQEVDPGIPNRQSPVFLIVACFDCDTFLKSTLMEFGADYVIDRIENIPAITRMIAKNGRAFPVAPHRYLPATTFQQRP